MLKVERAFRSPSFCRGQRSALSVRLQREVCFRLDFKLQEGKKSSVALPDVKALPAQNGTSIWKVDKIL